MADEHYDALQWHRGPSTWRGFPEPIDSPAHARYRNAILSYGDSTE